MAKRKPMHNPWGGTPTNVQKSAPVEPVSSPFSSAVRSPVSREHAYAQESPFAQSSAASSAPGWNTTSAAPRRAQAPLFLLAGTWLSALAGAALAVLSHSLSAYVLAWALASFVALGFAVVYMRVDGQRQASPYYLRRNSVRFFYGASVALALVATAVCAAQIALYMGRA